MGFEFREPGIIDSLTGGTHQWTIGTGSEGIFTQNGVTAENSRVYDTDPFGNTSVVWETTPDTADNADGGWNTSYFTVDNTKTYRFSVWVRKTEETGIDPGTFYFGLNGSPTAVREVANGSSETNPYWFYGDISSFTLNTWYLFVGHLFPNDYPHTYGNVRHPNTGYYTRASGKIASTFGGNMAGDAMFPTTTTSVRHRAYHYYCTTIPSTLQFFDPRIELVDGSEPTIDDLLNGSSLAQPTYLNNVSVSKEGVPHKHRRVEASGGDAVIENGEWRVHMFSGSGTFDLQSYVGESVEVEYLLVGGGGGGGSAMGGGGGGGGVITGYTYLTGNTYSITVGSGGSGAPAGTSVVGSNGGNSTFNGLTALGGGYGGIYTNTAGNSNGASGGSGGGASGYNNNSAAAGTYTGGAGTANQGYDGGDQGTAYYSGGGGGAGSAGADGNNKANGGNGKYSNILGIPYYWGGGGGGAGYSIGGGNGGLGGGGGGAVGYPAGNGGQQAITWGAVGTQGLTVSQANVPGGNAGIMSGGGGGGGSHNNLTNNGGNGGSGIVILRYKYR